MSGSHVRTRHHRQSSLEGGRPTPGTVERGACGRDRRVRVPRVAARDAGQHRAVGRVLQRERFSAVGVAPRAADVEMRSVELHRRQARLERGILPVLREARLRL